MDPKLAFALQFAWFLVAWSVVAVVLVGPRVRSWTREDRLKLWLAPLLFRVLGVGLLVEQLAPGMPRDFAVWTAAGDSITAALACLALLALHRRHGLAIPLAWAANAVGSLDLLVALPHAARAGAAEHLHAQWYVPALVVPLMIVAHVMLWRTLIGRGEGGPPNKA